MKAVMPRVAGRSWHRGRARPTSRDGGLGMAMEEGDQEVVGPLPAGQARAHPVVGAQGSEQTQIGMWVDPR